MKVIWQQRVAHYVDAMIALRAPGETGDITHEERLELFGGEPEAKNWQARVVGPVELSDMACAVRAGRQKAVGELWIFERIK